MENMAERANVEIAAVEMWGRNIPFVCSEFKSKKKFSDIWKVDQCRYKEQHNMTVNVNISE